MRILLLVLLICAVPALAATSIEPVGGVSWEEAAPGLSVSHSTWQRSDGSGTDLVVVRADSRRYLVRTLLASTWHQPRMPAADFRDRSGALLAINGPFFDEKGKPMGLIVADGKKVQGWPPPSTANGCVFGMRNGRPFISPRDGAALDGVTQAVQAAPRLLAGGSATDGIYQPDRVSRRTGVAVTRQGDLLIFCTGGWLGGLSFHELQGILTRAEFDAVDAMALDGGASTQMELKIGSYEESITAPDEVPVGLGLFKK